MISDFSSAHRLGCLLGMLGFFVAGANPAQAEDELLFAEVPVVATVSRLPQRLADAPTAVTVIDREMLRASGARDLNDVFRLVPGFQTFPHNTDSARVTYHGLTDEDFSPRVQVLVDGRSLYSPLFRNGINWALMPVAIEDIERIEVVRGSNAVSYGSNAFLGVINIITVDATLVRDFSVSVNHGGQGVRDLTLRGGAALGDAGSLRLTYQQRSDNGLTDRYDWRDFYDARLFSLRADLQPSTSDNLEISLGRAEAVSQFGRLDLATGVGKLDDPMRDYDQSSTHFQIQWRRALAAQEELRLRYALTEDWASDAHQETKPSTFKNHGANLPILMQVNAYGGRSRTQELEVQHRLAPFANTRVVWGASARYDTLSAPDYLYGRGEVSRQVARVFSNLEIRPISWLTVNGGASYEHDSLGGDHLAPRMSANFHLTPENTIRLGYAKAYRTGSIVDYLGDRRYLPEATTGGTPIPIGSIYRRRFLGDADLPTEKLETLEVGYLGEWKSLRMSLDVRAFHERIPNRLMTVTQSLAAPICNILDIDGSVSCSGTVDRTLATQSVNIQGLEYQWRWQPFESTRLLLSQAFVHIQADFLPDLVLSAQDRTKLDLLTRRSAPSHSTSMMWMQKLPWNLEFSASAYWLARTRWSQNTEAPAYQRIDARLAWPFRIGQQRGELAYTVQSLNGDHVEFKGWNGEDTGTLLAARIVERRDWISLRLDF